ncbi:MAG TPA: hypothetical protein VLW55_26720 [Burkholderiaceae bacterium]|nr:hypothetical protein [Burkholderiaceae bacterium]
MPSIGMKLRSDRLPQRTGVALAAATADALRSLDRLPAAKVLQSRVSSRLAALTDSLARWPVRQRRFLAAYPPSH